MFQFEFWSTNNGVSIWCLIIVLHCSISYKKHTFPVCFQLYFVEQKVCRTLLPLFSALIVSCLPLSTVHAVIRDILWLILIWNMVTVQLNVTYWWSRNNSCTILVLLDVSKELTQLCRLGGVWVWLGPATEGTMLLDQVNEWCSGVVSPELTRDMLVITAALLFTWACVGLDVPLNKSHMVHKLYCSHRNLVCIYEY